MVRNREYYQFVKHGPYVKLPVWEEDYTSFDSYSPSQPKHSLSPQSTDCVADSVQVSLSGDIYMNDATKYCGKQSLVETSQSNKLVVTLEGIIMGKVVCSLRIKDGKTAMDGNRQTAVQAPKKENKCVCGKKFEVRYGGHLPAC